MTNIRRFSLVFIMEFLYLGVLNVHSSRSFQNDLLIDINVLLLKDVTYNLATKRKEDYYMSLENAKQNLKEFGKELNLELNFDENHTCILTIDHSYSLHLTYEPNSDRLYLYSPIIDGLPKGEHKLKLYEALLEGSLLGAQMAGGGVGVAVREELILMHCVLEMGPSTDPASLRRFAPIFVKAVETWRKKDKDIVEGRETTNTPHKTLPPGMKPDSPPPPTPGDRFIKI